ncbi:MAG: hypothetical protein IT305_27330 [Chloroflexi bacterium]|nr:hypothetical protein [Chloroflexota bacterium]
MGLFGRLARALLLVIAFAFMGVMMARPLVFSEQSTAYASVAADNDNHRNNGGQSDDNSEERNLRGQVLELHTELTPPEALVATLGENVWARIYNDQIQRTGLQAGDHVHMQGEYNKGVFDAYEIDVTDRCCSAPQHSSENDNS